MPAYCEVVFVAGASGRLYTFEARAFGSPQPAVAGVYVVARVDMARDGTPIYVSQTVNLATTLDGHDALPWIHAQRPTHILVHRECDPSVRSEIEVDLCVAWAPVANAA